MRYQPDSYRREPPLVMVSAWGALTGRSGPALGDGAAPWAETSPAAGVRDTPTSRPLSASRSPSSGAAAMTPIHFPSATRPAAPPWKARRGPGSHSQR